MYQALSSRAAAIHAQFILTPDAATGQYASTESANSSATGRRRRPAGQADDRLGRVAMMIDGAFGVAYLRAPASLACALRSRGPQQQTLQREFTSACRTGARCAHHPGCFGDPTSIRPKRAASSSEPLPAFGPKQVRTDAARRPSSRQRSDTCLSR